MRQPLVALAGLLATLAVGADAPPGPRPRVVVELFSSEGCSSCPPADAYLSELDRAQPVLGVEVVALEFHVDYWDRLGWKDPFGSHDFGQRQRDYARALDDHRVFTPELVVDGSDILSSDEEGAFKRIRQAAREPKARVDVDLGADGEARVRVTEVPKAFGGEPLEVWLAVTERHLTSKVTAGENAGRVLVHAPVVRRLEKIGAFRGGDFQVRTTVARDARWKPSELQVVAFVAEARGMRIVGAGAQRLEP